MMTTPIIGSLATRNAHISAAYAIRQQEKLEKRLSYLVENYVALEDINPTQTDTFPKVLESLSILDDKLQKLKETMPKTAQTADKLWEELRESVEVRKPVKAKVKENLVNVVEFYAFLYEQASNRVTTPKFLQTQGQEHQWQGTWEKEFFIKEIRSMSDRQAVTLTLGTPRVKPLVMLQELRVDMAKLKEIQSAINLVAQMVNKYPKMVNLKKVVTDMAQQVSALSTTGFFSRGQANSETLLAKATLLFNSFSDFFLNDMNFIASLPEFAPGKEKPEEPLQTSLAGGAAGKVSDIIKTRLNPGGKIANSIRKWIPGIDLSINNIITPERFVKDIMALSYNELVALTGEVASLPTPDRVTQAASEVTPDATPKAQNPENTLRAKFKENPVQILNSQEYATILEPKAVQLMNLARNNDLKGFWNLVDDVLKPKTDETPAPQTATTPATTPPT